MASSSESVSQYLQEKQIPQLFESLMAGLMYHQPEDHLAYLQTCIDALKENKSSSPAWNQFINSKLSAVSSASKKSNEHELNAIFVLGGPGSGKGTQCARLVEKFGIDHVSVGDLLRDEVKKQSQIGREIDDLMKEGKMVPLDVVLNVLKTRLSSFDGSKCILIDGFPREMKQALEFEQKVGKVKGIFYFDCSQETMVQRLTKRGETSGRADDNVETIRKRLVTFSEQSLPVIEYFEKSGRLFKISSEKHPDQVFEDVTKAFDQLNH